jgi:hypothetical protein
MEKGLFLLLILTVTSYGCATPMGPKERYRPMREEAA